MWAPTSAALRCTRTHGNRSLCTYLSAILLGGLVMNALWGLWWADPVAALVMVPIIAKEGTDGLQNKACC